MNYDQFITYVQEAVQEQLGVEVTVAKEDIVKNNNVIQRGISITNQAHVYSPAIYMEDHYAAYKDGIEMEEIIDDILDLYQESHLEENIDAEFFTVYDRVKKRIVYKLINTAKNENILKKIPHYPFLDLSIVFYCLIEDDALGNATILIEYDHLKLWGIHEEQLYELAKRNSIQLLPSKFASITNMMEEIYMEAKEGDSIFQPSISFAEQIVIEVEAEGQKPPMFILTNRLKAFGAAVILYDSVLPLIAEQLNSDLYILPSSVHECIILPAEEDMPSDYLEKMVIQVNEEHVVLEEILSNRIYKYTKDSGKINFG